MPFINADRVMESSSTTGTGTLTLAGAVTGFQSFAAIGNANTCTYAVFAVDGSGVPTGDWETGIGTYTSSGTTLSRGVIESSNSNALVNFAAGTKRVIVCSVAKYAPLAMTTTGNRAIQVADQTALGSTSGNARGKGAVDLQIRRSSDTKVANGTYAVIAGGKNNTASGTYTSIGGGHGNTASNNRSTVAGGYNNSASGYSSAVCGGVSNVASAGRSVIAGGYQNTVSGGYDSVIGGGNNNISSGDKSVVGGGFRNTASGSYSAIAGGIRGKANKYGQQAHAAGMFSVQGDAQRSAFVLRGTTTNGTATEIFLDGSTYRLTLSDDTSWTFDGIIVARNTVLDTDVASYAINGSIRRGTIASLTVLDASNVTVIYEASATWDVTLAADTTNGSLKISVTGEALKTIQWVCSLRTVEVTG